jgi:hypothetical protein
VQVYHVSVVSRQAQFHVHVVGAIVDQFLLVPDSECQISFDRLMLTFFFARQGGGVHPEPQKERQMRTKPPRYIREQENSKASEPGPGPVALRCRLLLIHADLPEEQKGT